MKVRFVLLTEGSSDAPLVQHLEVLCVRAGAAAAEGFWLDFRKIPEPPGHKLADQLAWVKSRTSSFNLIFIHRDADSEDDIQARATIHDGITASQTSTLHVPVVPIQELEAWLLLDEATIRFVAGNPNGKTPLDLPKPTRIEGRARPKELLQHVIQRAAKAKRRTPSFGNSRRNLLERLDLDGPITQLSGWQKLVRDTELAVARLQRAPSPN